ncbi:MAG: DNA polymerase III subunit gamma/tau C-terminal domain-containing protein, partial [bacterium]
SRCLQFNLKQMPPGSIVSHLENILGQEDIEFELPALRLLAQGAQGSMRDGLSLTDQAIAYAAGKITLEAVQGMLGALDQSFLIRLLDALAAEDGAGLLAVADEMAARSLSYNAALQDLGTLLHRVALAQTVPQALPQDLPEREDVLRLAALFDAEEIQLFYQIAVHGRNELGLAPDEYAGFSMTLLRMLAFRPGIGGAQAIAATPTLAVARQPAPRMAAGMNVPAPASPNARSAPPHAPVKTGISPAMAALNAARQGSKSTSAATRSTSSPPASNGNGNSNSNNAPPPWDEDEAWSAASPSAPSASSASGFRDAAAQKKTESSAQPGSPADAVRTLTPHPAVTPTPAAPTPMLEFHPLPTLGWDGNWPLLAAALPIRGVVQQLALQSELGKATSDGDGAVLHFRVPMATLLSSGSVDKLTAALNAHFSQPLLITTEIGAVVHTASAQAKAAQAQRQREAEATIQNDPFVQTLMREFGATIVPGSIKPLLLKTQGE